MSGKEMKKNTNIKLTINPTPFTTTNYPLQHRYYSVKCLFQQQVLLSTKHHIKRVAYVRHSPFFLVSLNANKYIAYQT